MIGINSLITYVFASRNRPAKFFSALDNIKDLSVSGNYEIICSLDQDDAMMNNRDVGALLKQYDKVRAFYSKSYGKISAINRELQKINSETKIIICFSDDMEFTMKGFDVQIRNDMARYSPDTDGVLHYNDGTMNGRRLMTMSIIGKKYFDRTGYIYNPEYKSVYADDEAIQVAKILNKYFYSNKQLFKHNHWLFNMSKQDELNKKNDSPEMYAIDGNTYKLRKENNFYL